MARVVSADLRTASPSPATPAGSGGATILACDWNGTLVDDSTRAWKATSATLVARGLTAPTYGDFLARFRLPLSSLFETFGVDKPDVAQAEAEWNVAMRLNPLPPLMAGTESLLAAMAELGIRVGVISAASSDVVLSDAEHLGISQKLDFIVGSAKSKSMILAELADGGRTHVAYLGDTEHDVREANEAGATSIGFAGGYRPPGALASAGAKYMVMALTDVVPIMTGILADRVHVLGDPSPA